MEHDQAQDQASWSSALSSAANTETTPPCAWLAQPEPSA